MYMTHKIFILAIISTAVLARGSNALPDREAEAGSARSLTMRAFDEAGAVVLRAEIMITSLEIDEPLREDQFIIRGDEETRIWDNARARFVKEWPPKD
jgi:hypothetical protein